MSTQPDREDTDPDAASDETTEKKPPAGLKANEVQPSANTELVPLMIGTGFWVGLIILIAWFTEAGKIFLTKYWWLVAIGLSVLIFLGCLPRIIRWLRQTSPATRTALIVFVVIPMLLGGIGAIVRLEPTKQVVVLRSVFFAIVCLFPGLIYYLFIVTRRISLLNDYFVNLDRLGLIKSPSRSSVPGLSAADTAAKNAYEVRVFNYLQRFEALYGPLPDDLKEQIVESEDPLGMLADPQLRREVSSTFEQILNPALAIPVVLATVLIAIGWLLALPPIGTTVFEDINDSPVTYAFLGAYFFSLQMLFRRYVREDLRKGAYVAISLRIILAVIGTWAVVSAIAAMDKSTEAKPYLPVIGFVIGVFPRVVWQFIAGAWKAMLSKLGLSVILPSMESQLPVSDLDGLTVWHQARLEEEDIENVPNMATADIVDLMISTRFAPDRIIDWVDQAILYTAMGPAQKEDEKGDNFLRREQLRLHGVRTATSLIQALQGASARKDSDGTPVAKTLSDAARCDIWILVDAMRKESNLALISAWRGIELATGTASATPTVVTLSRPGATPSSVPSTGTVPGIN